MKRFGLLSTILLTAILQASAQEVSFKCSTDDPKMFLTIVTTAQESKIGERIQLSLTNKGLTYWKISLRANEIEDSTVTYESREGALATRRTRKLIPGKVQFLVNWTDGGATYLFVPPRGSQAAELEGECSEDELVEP